MVFREPPPPRKFVFFSKRPKSLSSLSLTPSYLLKVTKFLIKISYFKFSVMTEKNIFARKRFL